MYQYISVIVYIDLISLRYWLIVSKLFVISWELCNLHILMKSLIKVVTLKQRLFNFINS